MLLLPGIHLVEIDIARPVLADALVNGLRMMGWTEIALDRETLASSAPFQLRFVGRLGRAIETQDTANMVWSHASDVPFDIFGPMRLKVSPFQLLQGGTYALWIMARMRSHEKRADVATTLENEGFRVAKLSELKNNTRLPGRPGASVSFWYAIGDWTKKSSYVNTEYPFYFENVAEIAPPLAPSVSASVEEGAQPSTAGVVPS